MANSVFFSPATGGFYIREIHGDNIPADAVEITVEEYQALLEGQSKGKVIMADENGRPILQDPPPPTPEQIMAECVERTQKRLDDFARTRNYDNILSACTYATSTVPKFQKEGQYCVTARDATWAKLYEILAEVQAGTRSMPSGYKDIEPLLPPLEWPE